MKSGPFSLAIDGSNDTGREKMNPMTIRVFASNSSMVEHKFLDICTTSGEGAGTAEIIFSKMDSVLQKHAIPWANCISLAVDNASVNVGAHNSLRTRLQQKNMRAYVSGCPCHILHNLSSKGASALAEVTGFEIEEIVIDVAYWFDKSTKCKAGLEEFCVFCDTPYKEVVSHVSTRWLSLEQAVMCILQLYVSLTSYFLSNNEQQARFKRLHKRFADPITEVYLLFFQSVMPLFTNFNKMLQRGDPIIFLLYEAIRSFLKNLMS
jgi:hypothetical protein